MDELHVPFIFVPRGHPEPLEWMARHPGWVKVPAVMIRRDSPHHPMNGGAYPRFDWADAPPRPPLTAAPQPEPMPGGARDLGLDTPETILARAAGPLRVVGILPPPGGPGSPAGGGAAAVASVTVTPGDAGIAAALDAVTTLLARGVTTIEVIASERALAGLVAPLAALCLLLEPSRIQPDPPPGWFEAQRRPQPEALVPPEDTRQRPGESGTPELQPGQALPGSPAAPPAATVLPGTPTAEQSATVLEQKRNEGLEGGARTRPPAPRNAAKAADPAVTQALEDTEWEAHHLISIAGIKSAPDLIREAVKAGWRTDAPENVAPLPATAGAQEKLRRAGLDRKLHNSGHPDWNSEVRRRLEAIRRSLSDRGLVPGSDTYADAAKDELMRLRDELRQEIASDGRLSQIQPEDWVLPS